MKRGEEQQEKKGLLGKPIDSEDMNILTCMLPSSRRQKSRGEGIATAFPPGVAVEGKEGGVEVGKRHETGGRETTHKKREDSMEGEKTSGKRRRQSEEGEETVGGRGGDSRRKRRRQSEKRRGQRRGEETVEEGERR